MGKEPLTEIVMDNDSRELSQTVLEPYNNKVTLKKIVLGEILLRAGIIIGTIGATYGAIEFVRHYHLADYFR